MADSGLLDVKRTARAFTGSRSEREESLSIFIVRQNAEKGSLPQGKSCKK